MGGGGWKGLRGRSWWCTVLRKPNLNGFFVGKMGLRFVVQHRYLAPGPTSTSCSTIGIPRPMHHPSFPSYDSFIPFSLQTQRFSPSSMSRRCRLDRRSVIAFFSKRPGRCVLGGTCAPSPRHKSSEICFMNRQRGSVCFPSSVVISARGERV